METILTFIGIGVIYFVGAVASGIIVIKNFKLTINV